MSAAFLSKKYFVTIYNIKDNMYYINDICTNIKSPIVEGVTLTENDINKIVHKKIVQLSVGSLLGHGILKILSDEPLSGLFTYSYDKSKRELL